MCNHFCECHYASYFRICPEKTLSQSPPQLKTCCNYSNWWVKEQGAILISFLCYYLGKQNIVHELGSTTHETHLQCITTYINTIPTTFANVILSDAFDEISKGQQTDNWIYREKQLSRLSNRQKKRESKEVQ